MVAAVRGGCPDAEVPVSDVRLLGSVGWSTAGGVVDLGPAKQRTVFAALAVDVGRPVPTEVLIDRVWGEEVPGGARSGLYSYVTRLRRVLAGASGAGDGPPPVLVYERGGYVMDVAADRVDLHRFHLLVRQARAGDVGDAQRAAALDQAVGLWRGPALAGLTGSWAARTRDALAQQRMDAVLLWAQVLLRLGRGGEVIGALRDLLVEYPLVEPLAARLIEALYRDGRVAEALDCYARTRRRLVEELGSEPGPDLRRLHQTVLRSDATPAAVRPRPAAAVPAQLPLDLFGFVGRGRELAVLDGLLSEAGEQPTVVAIAMLSGTAGVGKTALAVHWAHRVAGAFPDGQLYVNLRGFAAGSKTSPGEAVRGFLEALKVPAKRIPTTVQAQVGLYRSQLAGKRVLVVLDNAATAEQVRPLLPGSPGCLVVVTSRNQLTGLVTAEGARPLAVGLLAAAEARELLRHRLGARVAAEPDAVDEIVRRCARLPLALAIVAARAATQQELPLSALAEQLRLASADLDPFADVDPVADLRAVFSWSYRALSAAAARVFRLIGLHPGPDLAPAVAASLAGSPVAQIQPALDELRNASLLMQQVPGRYVLHDLMRTYAHELATSHDSDADRREARHRMLDHYTHSAHAADRRLHPTRRLVPPPPAQAGVTLQDHADRDRALAWFVDEHTALLALVRDAAGSGFDRHVWHLAHHMTTYLEQRGRITDLLDTHGAALAAAQRLGETENQAYARRVLARARIRLGQYGAAQTHLRHALVLFSRLGDDDGQAHIHLDLGWAHQEQGHHGRALHHAQQASELFRGTGNRLCQAAALEGIAACQTRLGEHDAALVSGQQALTTFQEFDDSYGQAEAWGTLGETHHHLGHHQQATSHYERALELYRHLGNRAYEAETLTRLGENHRSAGHPGAAHQAWRQALAIFDDLDHPAATAVRERLDGSVRTGPAKETE